MFNPFKKDKSDQPTGAAGPRGDEDAVARAEGAEPMADLGPSETDMKGSEVDELRERLGALAEQLAQAKEERARALADYANFQRRSVLNERDAREMGVRGVLNSVLPVIDHFDMALGQAGAQAGSASGGDAALAGIVQGVTMIRDELLRALAAHGAVPIRPGLGEAFDPLRHKAIAHVPAQGVEPGAVVTLTRVGFVIGDRVVRPAEVVVAAQAANTGDAGATDANV